jgi:hypothetical protein
MKNSACSLQPKKVKTGGILITAGRSGQAIQEALFYLPEKLKNGFCST